MKYFRERISAEQIVRWFPVFVLGMVFFRALDFMLVSLRWPLAISMDASILRFESWSLMHGVWPWRDIVSINLPATHLIHILGILAFGDDDIGFRLLDLFWILSVSVLTGLYLMRYSRMAALTGAILVLTLPAEATPFGAFQRETLMLPFWLAILWSLESFWMEGASMGNLRRDALWFFAGAAASFASLIKPTTMVFYLFLILYIFHIYFWDSEGMRAVSQDQDRIARIKKILRYALVSAAGGLFVAILAAAVLASKGMLGILLHSWYSQTTAYMELYKTKSIGELALHLFTLRPDRWTLSLNYPLDGPGDTGHFTLFHISITLLWFYFMRKKSRFYGASLLVLAGIASYLLQKRGFQYHLYPAWYGFILMLSVVLSELRVRIAAWSGSPGGGRERGLRARVLVGGTLLLLCVTIFAIQSRSLSAYAGTGLYSKRHLDRIPNFKTVVAIGNLADKIRAIPEWKMQAIYLQTFESNAIAIGAVTRYRLHFASRYPVDYILWKESPFRAEARRDLMASLRLHSPAILAFSVKGSGEANVEKIRGFPELQEWMAKGYRLHETVHEVTGGQYLLYVRSDMEDSITRSPHSEM